MRVIKFRVTASGESKLVLTHTPPAGAANPEDRCEFVIKAK
jgi:hypothetical protein